MSSSSSMGRTTSSSSSDGYSSSASEKEGRGQIGENSVELATNQSSKGWYILALVVGSLVFVGGVGFGATGLMQANGVFSFPPNMQWLTSAFNTVNNALPLSGCLWIMTVGGGVVSITLIAVGSVGIDREKRKEKAEEEGKSTELASVLARFIEDPDLPNETRNLFNNQPNKVSRASHPNKDQSIVIKSDKVEHGTEIRLTVVRTTKTEAEEIMTALLASRIYSEL